MRIFFELLAKVFAFVAAGALVSRLMTSGGRARPSAVRDVSARAEKFFVGAVYYVAVPLFIVFSFVQVEGDARLLWRPAAAAVFVLACGFAAAFVFARASSRRYRDVVLPVAVMNSAYLAIPVNTVLFGRQGAFWAVIYNVTVTAVHFTLGAMILKRGAPGGNSARTGGGLLPLDLPAPWAMAAGVLIRLFFSDSAAADFMRGIYPAVAAAVLPVMLFFVGMKTARMSPSAWRPAAAGVILRIAGGFLAGVAAVGIFSLSGAAAAVCVMSSSMPSAVNTYILAGKFGADEDFAASMVLAGTVLSALSVPAAAVFVRAVFMH